MSYQVDFEYDSLCLNAQFADDDYFVALKSDMKLDTFEGMKQPVPSNAMMGYQIIVDAKHKGEPLADCSFSAKWDDQQVEYKTNAHGRGIIVPPMGSKVTLTF